jgi:hypothetical protein
MLAKLFHFNDVVAGAYVSRDLSQMKNCSNYMQMQTFIPVSALFDCRPDVYSFIICFIFTNFRRMLTALNSIDVVSYFGACCSEIGAICAIKARCQRDDYY